MPQSAALAQPQEETLSGMSSEGEERHAPNGRIAVLVDGLWAGYIFDESQSGRGTNRRIVLFEVDVCRGALLIRYKCDCRGKSKKDLEKRIHHDHKIRFFDATTTAGIRCQLFTL